MADYSKLIVSCSVKHESKKELEEKVAQIPFTESYYQSCESIVHIVERNDDLEGESLDVIIVGQTKFARGQREFCEWLKPHVIQGSGDNDVYAMSFSDYSDDPQIWKLSEE